MRKGLQRCVLWLLSTRWVEPIVLLSAGALAWLGSMFLPGLSAVWLRPLGLMAFLGVLALSPQPWGRFSAASVSLLERHTGSVVTVATFTASAALVAFAMVASVATPELGQELSKAGELVLFAVVTQHVAVLALTPFLDSSAANLDISTTTTVVLHDR